MRLLFMTILATAMLILGSGCTKRPGLTPIKNVECGAETGISEAFSLAVAGALNCSAPGKIRASFMTVLGNVNMCKTTATAMARLQLKRGDVKAKGILGNIVCPSAVNAAVGFLSAEIPAEWGCSPKTSVGVETVSALVTTACEGAIPI